MSALQSNLTNTTAVNQHSSVEKGNGQSFDQGGAPFGYRK